jgi:hypothetical protein
MLPPLVEHPAGSPAALSAQHILGLATTLKCVRDCRSPERVRTLRTRLHAAHARHVAEHGPLFHTTTPKGNSHG